MKPAKVDKRTKAFRQAAVTNAQEAMTRYKAAQIAPKPGEAETVLSILALLANYDAEVKKRILVRAGQLA